MRKHPALLGAGLSLIIVSVLAYMAYGIQYHRLQTEIMAEFAGQAGEQTARESPAPMPALTPMPAAAITEAEIVEMAEKLGMAFPVAYEPEPMGLPEAPELFTVTIRPGMSSGRIAQELKTAGVIEDNDAFSVFLAERNATRSLHAGVYRFPRDCPFTDILAAIGD